MSKLSNKTILLISPESWGENFVSKHHYANYIAKNDNKVFFLNPVSSFSINPLSSLNILIEPIDSNISIVSYKNPIPKLNNFPKKIQEKFYQRIANDIQNAIKDTIDIVWNFDPFRFFNQKVWKAEKYIYHTVDIHRSLPYEADLAQSSDLVLLSAEYLKRPLIPFNSNIHNLGHGADIQTFKKRQNVKLKTIPGNNKIKAGFIGALHNRIDYELLFQMAKKNPTIDFILIGPYKKSNLGPNASMPEEIINKIIAIENLILLGPIPSNQIIDYLSIFDINLVLYNNKKQIVTPNPHKLMGYFYAGRTTISTWCDEYKNADKELIYMSEDSENIPQMIQKVAQNLSFWNSSTFAESRKSFALKNDYRNKIQEIETLLYK